MSALPSHLMALVQTGGTTPAVGGFGSGAGLGLVILVIVIVDFVAIALVRAGKRNR